MKETRKLVERDGSTGEVRKSISENKAEGEGGYGVLPRVGERFANYRKLAEAMGEVAATNSRGRESQMSRWRGICHFEKEVSGNGYRITSVHLDSTSSLTIEEYETIKGQKLIDIRVQLVLGEVYKRSDIFAEGDQDITFTKKELTQILGLVNQKTPPTIYKQSSEEQEFFSATYRENQDITDYLLVRMNKLKFITVVEGWEVKFESESKFLKFQELCGKSIKRAYSAGEIVAILDYVGTHKLKELEGIVEEKLNCTSFYWVIQTRQVSKYYALLETEFQENYGITYANKVVGFRQNFARLEAELSKRFLQLEKAQILKKHSNDHNIEKLLRLFKKAYNNWTLAIEINEGNSGKHILDYKNLPDNRRAVSKLNTVESSRLVNTWIKLET